MPKHVLLFFAFLALLIAIFYHPIPNPVLWDKNCPDYAPAIKTETKTAKAENQKLRFAATKNDHDNELSQNIKPLEMTSARAW